MKKIVFAAVLICMFLAGCTNTYYTDRQSDTIAAEGKALITEYLNSNYSDYKLNSCYMMTGAKVDTNPYAGYYTSDYVEGKYTAEEKNHTIVVNIKTGDVYTDEQNGALCDYMKEKLKPYIADAGYEDEFLVDNVQLEYVLYSRGVQSGGKKLDTQVSLYGVLPVKYHAENFDELISPDNTAGDFFQMTVLFHNDGKGRFPNDALKKYSEDHAFFGKGMIYVYNLSEEDFSDILSGRKDYHYSMEKAEEYSIFLGQTE